MFNVIQPTISDLSTWCGEGTQGESVKVWRTLQKLYCQSQGAMDGNLGWGGCKRKVKEPGNILEEYSNHAGGYCEQKGGQMSWAEARWAPSAEHDL